jgi:predicted histidine transporter YuiF (NhaC family)
MARKNSESVAKKNAKYDRKGAGLLIPAGLLIGMGFGFAFGNIPAGLFLGLGIGFLFFAMIRIQKE